MEITFTPPPMEVITTAATNARTAHVEVNCGGRRCGPPIPAEETPAQREPPAPAQTSAAVSLPSATPSLESVAPGDPS